MKKLMLFMVFSLYLGKGYGQIIVKDTLRPAFEWNLHLLDLPYMTDAAKAEALRAADGQIPFKGTIRRSITANFTVTLA